MFSIIVMIFFVIYVANLIRKRVDPTDANLFVASMSLIVLFILMIVGA